MPIGTRISYLSGFAPQLQVLADKRPIDKSIDQRVYIAGGDEEYAQQLLNDIVEADQLSFYALNVSKVQLTQLVNDYNYNSNPQGWTVAQANEANKVINDINAELNKLGNRQIQIANDPDLEVETGIDNQFSEFVGINGVQKIGIIPVIIIVVAIIVAGVILYELIQWLENLTIESEATVEKTEILKKAAEGLTPEEDKAYWADIQHQVDKAYKAGYASGNDGSLLGDASNLLMWGVVGFVAFKGIELLQNSQSKRPASVSGPRKKRKTIKKRRNRVCKICALKRGRSR